MNHNNQIIIKQKKMEEDSNRIDKSTNANGIENNRIYLIRIVIINTIKMQESRTI